MQKFIRFVTMYSVFTASAVHSQNLSGLFGALGAMAGATNQQAVAVVDFRELRALLPETIGAFKRTRAGGEKNSAMGMTMSQADGEYASGTSKISIKIMDFGGTGMAGLMAAGWAMSEVDRESDSDFERSTTIRGHKALEKYNTHSKSGDIQILVAGRFMVEIIGYDCSHKDIRAAAEALDLAKLAALKK
jgi:hypothetical protein